MNDSTDIRLVATALIEELIAAGKTVATAESCTGGWIAKALTDVAGSSQCFGYGIVSYSNAAKESLLAVNATTLNEYGAVSEPVVKEMATGVLALSSADLCVSVSGVAGPDGGTDEKPVGTVWICWGKRRSVEPEIQARLFHLAGDRDAVRSQTVLLALAGIKERI